MPSEKVRLVSSDGHEFSAYLGVPEAPNGGAVLVLQEIFGINANIRGIVDDLAAAGYHGLAPDLFSRQEHNVELDPDKEEDRASATALMKGLDPALALSDTDAAAAYLRSIPGLNGKVGCVGYCLGGKLAYLMATTGSLNCSVSYYGVGIQGVLDKAGQIDCPLLLHIAEEDHLCPPEAQVSIAEAMAPFAPQIRIISHPGVGHAFARRGGGTFIPEAAEVADNATAELFAKCLL